MDAMLQAIGKERCRLYLGDGLYASYDGYHVQLRAARPHGDVVSDAFVTVHQVALEPGVLHMFGLYVKRVHELLGSVSTFAELPEEL